MQENNKTQNVSVEEEGFSFKKMFSYAIGHWKMFLLSAIVCIGVAVFYLRTAVPQYQVTAKILLQDSEKGTFTSSADMLADFGFQTQNSNVENEVEVIKSMSVVSGAVIDAGLNVEYALPGFYDRPIYKDASPVKVYFGVDSLGQLSTDSLMKLRMPIALAFRFNSDGGAEVSYDYTLPGEDVHNTGSSEILEYPHVVKTEAGNILVVKNGDADVYVKELIVNVLPVDIAARSYMSRLSVAPISKTSSVSVMAVNTPVPECGMDFLNAVIESYNKVTNAEKHQVALQTKEFIDVRISFLKGELEVMETRLSAYKKDNQLISPQLDASVVSQNKAEYTKQLEEIELMLKSSKTLKNFVNDVKNDKKSVPTTFGVEIDQPLVAIINSYNREVIEFNNLSLTATGDNPKLVTAEKKVELLQSELKSAIEAYDASLREQRDAIKSLLAGYTSRYEQSPDIERGLMTLEREHRIKSDLYVMLLQKMEENDLSLSVTSNNLRCIDSPIFAGQVAPSRNMVLLIALFIAVAIPALIIYLRETLRTVVTVNDDVSLYTQIARVGSVPLVKGKVSSIVVARNNNDVMAESFRNIRTNLQFMMKNSTGKVVMFTSTTSGEGKTFVASNLAMSVALLNKKVLLIGLDIRRPRLAELFGLNRKAEGLTSYLVADENDTHLLDKFIVPSGVDENLSILPAGIVPPNPAELLARPNLDRAIEYLAGKYDYIVLDTAPVGLVTDSVIISRVADAVAYVVRYDYTKRMDLKFLNMLVSEGKLENVSLVLNAEDRKKKLYGYYSSEYREYSNRYIDYGPEIAKKKHK